MEEINQPKQEMKLTREDQAALDDVLEMRDRQTVQNKASTTTMNHPVTTTSTIREVFRLLNAMPEETVPKGLVGKVLDRIEIASNPHSTSATASNVATSSGSVTKPDSRASANPKNTLQ